jgi:hypothetical protein
MEQYLVQKHSTPALPTGPTRTPKTFKMDDIIDLTESPPASLDESKSVQGGLRESSPVDMFTHAKHSKLVDMNSQSMLDDDDDDLMDALDELEESTVALGAVMLPKVSQTRHTTADSLLVLSGESSTPAATVTTQLLDALLKHVPEEHDNALWYVHCTVSASL